MLFKITFLHSYDIGDDPRMHLLKYYDDIFQIYRAKAMLQMDFCFIDDPRAFVSRLPISLQFCSSHFANFGPFDQVLYDVLIS